MSVHGKAKKVTTHTLQEMKRADEKITMLTAYDYSLAKLVDNAGVDVILVGDSASNVMAGWETTVESNFSFGPVVHNSSRSYPRISDASSKSALAAGTFLQVSSHIPTNCAPCPGNINDTYIFIILYMMCIKMRNLSDEIVKY